MLIKICGVMDPETARFAVRSGANFIGILLSDLSPRKVDLTTASLIIEAVRQEGGEAVGVFVDENETQILSIAEEIGLEIVQLHGDGSRQACEHIPIAKIYVVGEQELPSSLDPARDFLLFEPVPNKMDPKNFRFFIAGKLNPDNVKKKIEKCLPHGVDVSSGIEERLTIKCPQKIAAFIQNARPSRYGKFGGQFVPELLMEPLEQLRIGFESVSQDERFQKELRDLLRNYAGRPTALTEVPRFAKAIRGPRIFLKREDLLHTGAHKINNALGQCLLAKRMGKNRIIAETGAGQHGVATATVCALLGLQCTIYMGKKDMERQSANVDKIRLLGAEIVSVEIGSMTLKEAVNEALRDWAASYETTHYCLGSALGPHPFPEMVAQFQECIGKEAKSQMEERLGKDPDLCIACVGGGSNAIGLFRAYLDKPHVQLVGVEAGGKGKLPGEHAARFQGGSPGVLHGSYTYVLQDQHGQIGSTHSVSAGLDYPAVGPQHAALHEMKKVRYEACSDVEALEAFRLLARTEGIIPALESSHALGYLMRIAHTLPSDAVVLVNLSGRGDKDLDYVSHL